MFCWYLTMFSENRSPNQSSRPRSKKSELRAAHYIAVKRRERNDPQGSSCFMKLRTSTAAPRQIQFAETTALTTTATRLASEPPNSRAPDRVLLNTISIRYPAQQLVTKTHRTSPLIFTGLSQSRSLFFPLKKYAVWRMIRVRRRTSLTSKEFAPCQF